MAERDVNFKINVVSDGKAVQEYQAIGKAAKEAGELGKKAMAEVAAATKNAEKAAEELAKVQANRAQQMTEGFKKLGEGSVAFGRAIGLAGVATSENMEMAVKMFARYEAGVQLFKGVADSVEGARKIWSAYTAASKAAAAADTAATTAALLRSRASSGAGVASAVAGSGGVAGAAGGAAGAMGALGGIAAAAAPIIVGLTALAAVLVVVSSIFPSFGKALKGLITGTDEAAEAAKKSAEGYKQINENFQQWEKQNEQSRKEAKGLQTYNDEKADLAIQASGGSSEDLAKARLARAQARFDSAQGTFNAADATHRGNLGSPGFSEKAPEEKGYFQKSFKEKWATIGVGESEKQQYDKRKEAYEQRRQAIANMSGAALTNAGADLGDARNELKEAIKQAAEEEAKSKQALAQKELKHSQELAANSEKQLKLAEDKLGKEEKGLQAVRDKVKAEEDRLKSAQEKFVDMSPTERKALVAAQKKAEAGGELDKRERDLLRGDGLNQDLIARDTEAKVKNLSPDEMGYFDRQNKVVATEKQKESEASKAYAAAEAEVKKLEATVAKQTAAIGTAEQALAQTELYIKGQPARIAKEFQKLIAANDEALIREIRAETALANEKARSAAKVNVSGGAK